MSSVCHTCGPSGCTPTHKRKKMGINGDGYDYLIALAGNPNTGKSTLFNALTGLKQHVGNWAGKTVTRAEGSFAAGDNLLKLIDLPGAYSLRSTSPEEEVARDFLLFGEPDCTIVVADATNLERNLNLILQVIELSDRVVVAINLMDEAEKRGISIKSKVLERKLGVPAVPIIARSGEGIDKLMQIVLMVSTGEIQPSPKRFRLNGNLKKAVASLLPKIKETYPDFPNPRWLAMELLSGNERLSQELVWTNIAEQMQIEQGTRETATA